jgi:ATP-dependent DNA ligase
MQAVPQSSGTAGDTVNYLDWAMFPVPTGKHEIDTTKWYAQPKLDGHRLLVVAQAPTVVLLVSKGGHQLLAEKPPGWHSHLAVGTTLDGELVSGYFYAFDILSHRIMDVTDKPHRERMTLLKKAIPKADHAACIGVYQNVPALWSSVQAANAEGLVLKDPRGIYRSGASRSWRKVKNTKVIKAFVASTTPNKAGVTAKLVHPETGKNLGKVHTTRFVNPGETVRVRYCQRYPDGRLREAVIIP